MEPSLSRIESLLQERLSAPNPFGSAQSKPPQKPSTAALLQAQLDALDKTTQPAARASLPAAKRVRFETGTKAPAAAKVRQPTTGYKSFEAAREHQVMLMAAGQVERPHEATAWPRASDKLLQAFAARHSAYKTYSDGYMQTQARMLFLLDVEPSLRHERFEQECFIRKLAPTTAATYWVAFLTLDKIVNGTDTTDASGRVREILDKRARVHPVCFPQPLTPAALRAIHERFGKSAREHVALITTCWTLGQRFGDFIQLPLNDFYFTTDEVRLTFRLGKTVGHVGPYTLPLPLDSPATAAFLDVRQAALERGWGFIGTKSNDKDDCRKLKAQVSATMAAVDERLELRSIRRGGLQNYASLGFELDEIRVFSKHTNDDMLMRYLNWGQCAEARMSRALRMTKLMKY